MKITRRLGFNNYGMYPKNEYTKANVEIDIDSALNLSDAPQTPDAALEPPEPVRRLHYKSGSWNRGWLSSRSTSGWRAKAAAQQHEDKHM